MSLYKGRKQRSVPLWRQMVRLLRQWLKEIDASPEMPVVPNGRGAPMTRAGVAQRLRRAVEIAAVKDSSLLKCRISPHIIRHTTAIHLLQSGVDLSVIAMWLGHESIQTTHQYLKADLESKKKTLKSLESPQLPRKRRIVKKSLIRFLEGL